VLNTLDFLPATHAPWAACQCTATNAYRYAEIIMKLQRLKIFESISRHLNVTAAADEMHLSQPAASLQLKLLEQEYGLVFYRRKSNGMELTEAGRDFLAAIRPILAGMDAVDAKFKERNRNKLAERIRPAKTDVIAVGSNHWLLESVFSSVLLRFREHWRPDADVVLEIGGSNSIESLVEDSRLDVALISNPRQLPNCHYEAFQETKYEVAVVAAPSYPVCRTGSMTLEELVKQSLVVRSGSTCVEELRRRGYQFKSTLQCRTPDAAKLAISKGFGLGLVLRSWVHKEIERGELRVINVPELKAVTYQSFITWNRRKALSNDAQHLIETMREMRDQRLCA
jgi:LysR family transcriptional regulator, low CO2-responsive transcriptional regulator